MYETYIKARNCYSYPPVGLVAVNPLENVEKWQNAYKEYRFDTTYELDQHHFTSLTSNKDADVLLGIYSVIYWGNITAGPKSKTRCDWISIGNAKNKKWFFAISSG